MDIEELLHDDAEKRKDALSRLASEPAASQAALAQELSERAAELAAGLACADGEGEDTDDIEAELARVTETLASIDAPVAHAALLAASRHDCALVRRKLVSALLKVRTEHVRHLLATLVRDPDLDVRNDAAAAVRARPWAGASEALLAALDVGEVPAEETTRALAATAALASDETRRAVAMKLLDVARSAAQQARHLDRHLCLRALDALVESGATFPGVQEAASELAQSEDLRTRVAGIALRAGGGHADPLRTLIELVAKGSTDESASAAVQLRNLPAPLVASGLVTAMRAADPLVRERAASLAVGTIFLAREASLDSLLALASDEDEGVRAAAVTALARCLPAGRPFFLDRKELIAPTLVALMGDPSKKVTDAVARAKAVLGVG